MSAAAARAFLSARVPKGIRVRVRGGYIVAGFRKFPSGGFQKFPSGGFRKFSSGGFDKFSIERSKKSSPAQPAGTEGSHTH